MKKTDFNRHLYEDDETMHFVGLRCYACHWSLSYICCSLIFFQIDHLLKSLPNLQAATKILARQLVRLRKQIANLQGSRAQMRGIATHTQVCAQDSILNYEIHSVKDSISDISDLDIVLFITRLCMLNLLLLLA